MTLGLCMYMGHDHSSPGIEDEGHSAVGAGCLQLLEILEISWNLKFLLEILEISWNFVYAPEKKVHN